MSKKFKIGKKSVASKNFNVISDDDAMSLQDQFAEMFKKEEAGETVDFNAVQEESARAAEEGYNAVMADLFGVMGNGSDDSHDEDPGREYSFGRRGAEQEIPAAPQPVTPHVETVPDYSVLEKAEEILDEYRLITKQNREWAENMRKNIPGFGENIELLCKQNANIQSMINHLTDNMDAMRMSMAAISDKNVPIQKTDMPIPDDTIPSHGRPFAGIYQNENGWWNPKDMTLTVSDGKKSACTLDLGGADVDAILYRYMIGTSKNVSEWTRDTTKDDIIGHNELLEALILECISAMNPYLIMTAKEFIDVIGASGKWHPDMAIRYIKITRGKWDLEEGAYIMIYLIDKHLLRDDLANMLSRAVLLGKPYTIAKIFVDYLEEYGFHFQPYDIKKGIDADDRDEKIHDIADRIERFGMILSEVNPEMRDSNAVNYADAFVSALVRTGVMLSEKTLQDAYDALDDLFDHIADDDEESEGNLDESGNLVDPESGEAPEDADFDSDEEAYEVSDPEEEEYEDLDEEDGSDEESETVYSDTGSETVPNAFSNLQNIPVDEVSEEPEIEDVEDIDLANASLPDATTETPKEQRYIYRPQQ